LNLSSAKEALASILGQEFVQMEGQTLVVFPANAEEISAVFKKATTEGFKVAVVGNEYKGGFAEEPQLVVSTSRMNKILEVDRDNMLVIVQAGMNTAAFQQELLEGGLYFPPDPMNKSTSTLGANVATRAAGPNEASHGEVVDFMLGLTAVLPNGEIFKVGGKNYKNVAALDLNRFYGGSYGRLGVITELIFRLLPKPEVTVSAFLKFPSVKDAAQVASLLTTGGVIPNKLEILNRELIKQVESEWPAEFLADGIVLMELEGYQESIEYQKEIIIKSLGDKVKEFVELSDEQAAKLWQLRDKIGTNPTVLEKQMHLAVDPTKLLEAVNAIFDVKEGSLGLAIQGSAARLYPIFFGLDEDKELQVKDKVQQAIKGLNGVVLRDGLDYNPETNSEVELTNNLFAIFDPNGIMVV